MAKTDLVHAMAEPLAAAEGADVYDVTFNGGKLSVAINRQGGIDLDTLTAISRVLGEQLEERDVISGSYTLEVTSPGLERPLRTPGHYAGAVGEDVTIRTTPDTEGERRVRGTIVSSDDTTVTVELEDDGGQRTLELDTIERARTTFSWGPEPKPNSRPAKSGSGKQSQNKKERS